jgi:hypothetical protein
LYISFYCSAGVRFRTVPNRKQIFTHTLCSLLSAIIKIAEPPSRHLEKSDNNNITQPRLRPRGRLIEYCFDSRHLAAHSATTFSSRATFKFRLFLGLHHIISFTYTIILRSVQPYTETKKILDIKKLFGLKNGTTFVIKLLNHFSSYFYILFSFVDSCLN